MKSHVTVDELHAMSGGAIQALPKTMPIKDGESVVGVLIPIHKVSREYVANLLDRIDEEAAKRTPEETRRLENLLGEREPE